MKAGRGGVDEGGLVGVGGSSAWPSRRSAQRWCEAGGGVGTSPCMDDEGSAIALLDEALISFRGDALAAAAHMQVPSRGGRR